MSAEVQLPNKRAVNWRLLALVVAGVAVVPSAYFFGRSSNDSAVPNGATSLPGTMLDVALGFHNAGRLDDALQAYGAVLKSDPTNKFALYNIGVIKQQRGELDSAIERYSAVLAIDSAFNPARYNRGLAYRDSKRINLAIEDFSSVLKSDAKNASAMYNLGQIYIAQGRTVEGSTLVSRALEINPSLDSK